MGVVKIGRLGLAAYVKMNGGIFVKYLDGRFYFETSKAVDAWEVDYINSCCSRHDTELMTLRKLMK